MTNSPLTDKPENTLSSGKMYNPTIDNECGEEIAAQNMEKNYKE